MYHPPRSVLATGLYAHHKHYFDLMAFMREDLLRNLRNLMPIKI